MAVRVMILAGGTGGHVFPALAVAENLRDKGADISWIGTKRGLEAKVVPSAGINIDWLQVTGIRGKGWADKLKAPFMLLLACCQAGVILIRRKPDVVLGMGGFVSGPSGLVASMMRIPLVIHEQNRVPGTTNRILAKFARVVLEAFPGSFSGRIDAGYCGNPLRKEITASQNSHQNRGKTPRILVLGGSLGARVLNQTLAQALSELGQAVEVIHQTGQAGLAETKIAYKKAGVNAEVIPFIDDMADAYNWVDLVICRSGAMTISELAATGKPSILVPFPYAIDDHQMRNAEYLSKSGAAVLIPQSEFNAGILAKELRRLVNDPAQMTSMGKAARTLARLDATDTVADICLQEART